MKLSYTSLVKGMWVVIVALLLSSGSYAAKTAQAPGIRWAEGAPGCTFRNDDQGHSYYGLTAPDFEITLTVDRQELEKTPHRAIPMLGVHLAFHYTGSQQLEVQQNRFVLEFVKHFQAIKGSLDPDGVQQEIQDDIDNLTDEVERHQVKKHPDQKDKMETELQARLKDYTEMMDFVSTRALRPITLDPSNSSVSGWVFFGIKGKWIGPWRKPEQFILRMPVENLIVEIPFQLPPQHGKVELQRRPEQ